jgi:hypothetical protein
MLRKRTYTEPWVPGERAFFANCGVVADGNLFFLASPASFSRCGLNSRGKQYKHGLCMNEDLPKIAVKASDFGPHGNFEPFFSERLAIIKTRPTEKIVE